MQNYRMIDSINERVRSNLMISKFFSLLHSVSGGHAVRLSWILSIDKVLFDGPLYVGYYSLGGHNKNNSISTNLIKDGSRDSELLLSKQALYLKDDKDRHVVGIHTDLIEVGKISLREVVPPVRFEGTLDFRGLSRGKDYDISGLKKKKTDLVFIDKKNHDLFVSRADGSLFDLKTTLYDFKSVVDLYNFIWAEHPDKGGVLGRRSIVLKSVRAVEALESCLVAI